MLEKGLRKEIQFDLSNFNCNDYLEITNGYNTYKEIAKHLVNHKPIIIGWADGKYDHRDISFNFEITQKGILQRGLKGCYLFVSIMGWTSMGFLMEMKTDNRKNNNYIKEKLDLNDDYTSDKICDLINGVIYYIDNFEKGEL